MHVYMYTLIDIYEFYMSFILHTTLFIDLYYLSSIMNNILVS